MTAASRSTFVSLVISHAAQLACLIEVSIPKPGNVHSEAHFPDTRYEDFLASALAIGEAIGAVHRQGVGRTIWRAVRDLMRRCCRCSR